MKNIIDEDFFENSTDHAVSTFETYQTYASVEQAKEVITLLKKARIPYSLEKPILQIDPLITGSIMLPAAVLRIPGTCFTQVNEMLEAKATAEMETGNDDNTYYLYEYSDKELLEVVANIDEWHMNDVILAKVILKNRGISLSENEINTLRAKHLTEIRKPKKGKHVWMLITLIACFIAAYLFTFVILVFSLGWGYYYWQDTTVDPEGKKFKTFDQETRNIGIAMMATSVLGFALGILALRLGMNHY